MPACRRASISGYAAWMQFHGQRAANTRSSSPRSSRCPLSKPAYLPGPAMEQVVKRTAAPARFSAHAFLRAALYMIGVGRLLNIGFGEIDRTHCQDRIALEREPGFGRGDIIKAAGNDRA